MTGIVVGQQPRSIGRLGLAQPAGLQHMTCSPIFILRPAVIEVLDDPFAAAQLGNAVLAAQPGHPRYGSSPPPKTTAGRRISFTRVSRLRTRNRGAWRDSHAGRRAEEERAAIVKHDGGIP